MKTEDRYSIRYKTRWVAKGFIQRYDVDFDQTWASVMRLMSYKALYAWACANNWHIRQGDVKTAFLNEVITEEIYAEQPTDFQITQSSAPLVCLLNKALYGLKQSPRIWYQRIRTRLEKLELTVFPNDESCFIHPNQKLVVTLYIDDVQYFGESLDEILDIERKLKKTFKMTNTGTTNFYLRMNIHYNRKAGIYHLNQSTYIERIIRLYNYTNLKLAFTPMRVD